MSGIVTKILPQGWGFCHFVLYFIFVIHLNYRNQRKLNFVSASCFKCQRNFLGNFEACTY